ncbi:DUF3224 domain-containing protein [Glaciecola sp. MF2-115]|uniref:DUF3224 domain-containing protein n=1 Tax=Glaciecola sp. MF2-115 TaxID=3384827 RepID=UPI0039A2CFD8
MNSISINNWDEVTLKEYEDKKLSHAKVQQTYDGLLQGSSEVNYQMAYTSESTASYVGTELFEGSINGKSGSLVFLQRGTYAQGRVQSKFEVAPNSGTGELTGISGHGEFASSEAQSVEYSFEYKL